MDRRVKERLVGASILVVLFVLIVPELLSGPTPGGPVGPRLPVSAPEPVRNVTVDLATAKPPEPETAVDAAAASSATPAGDETGAQPTAVPAAAIRRSVVPSMSRSSALQRAASPSAAPPATASPGAGAAAPLESPPSALISPVAGKPAITGHTWAIQLGSFASRANADKLVRQVKAHGFAVYVLSSGSGASQRHRVRIGPLADRSAATQAAAKLKALGHTGSVVPPAA